MLFLVPLREILERLRWPVEAENHLLLAPRWFDNSSRNSFWYFLSFGDWRPRILLFYHLDVRVRTLALSLHHFLVYFLVGLTWMLIYVWGLIDVNDLFCILISVSIVFIIVLLEILVTLFRFSITNYLVVRIWLHLLVSLKRVMIISSPEPSIGSAHIRKACRSEWLVSYFSHWLTASLRPRRKESNPVGMSLSIGPLCSFDHPRLTFSKLLISIDWCRLCFSRLWVRIVSSVIQSVIVYTHWFHCISSLVLINLMSKGHPIHCCLFYLHWLVIGLGVTKVRNIWKSWHTGWHRSLRSDMYFLAVLWGIVGLSISSNANFVWLLCILKLLSDRNLLAIGGNLGCDSIKKWLLKLLLIKTWFRSVRLFVLVFEFLPWLHSSLISLALISIGLC